MLSIQDVINKAKSGAYKSEDASSVCPAEPVRPGKPAGPDVTAKGYKDEPCLEYEYITDTQAAKSAVDELTRDFASNEILGIDIEVAKKDKHLQHPQAGLEPHLSDIRQIQLCRNESKVYVFDAWHTGLEVLRPVFSKTLVAHNAVFELKHLWHNNIQVPEMHCTMLMNNAVYFKNLSLQELCDLHLKEGISKEEQTSNWNAKVLFQKQLKYAAKDALYCLRLYNKLIPRISDQKPEPVYNQLQQAQYPVMKMIYYGCHFDAVQHFKFIEVTKKQHAELKAKIQDTMGKINLGSSQQVSRWLSQNLKKRDLKKLYKTETGFLKTDEENLSKLYYLPVIELLLEFKKLDKILSSFGEGFTAHINPETGRIHASFNIAAASSGRFSCNNPNLQQLPKGKHSRSLICAPSGYKLVCADYSQIELRVLAIMASEEVMLKAYKMGKDLHRLTAANVQKIPYEQVTSKQRSAAKPINFGINYGMGAPGLARYAKTSYGQDMTENEARQAISAYFETYPMIAKWHKQVLTYSKCYGFAKTRLGRKVHIKEIAKIFTKSKNIPVQGSAAEVFLAGLIRLDNRIVQEGIDAKIVNIVHDEIVLEVAEDEVQKASSILEEAMTQGMLDVFPEAETKDLVEAAVGNNWYEAKP